MLLLLLAPVAPLVWVALLVYYLVSFRRRALLPSTGGERFDLTLAAAGDTTVTLVFAGKHPPADLAHAGTFGLHWRGGYGQAGPVMSASGKTVVRERVSGAALPATGTPVRLDSFAFPTGPSDRGLAYEDVVVAGPLGPMPAWKLDGASDSWAILVHGKGASRREFLRMLPAVVAAGLPALVITYRNDAEAPRSANGHYGYGATEWPDLEAAVRCALDSGARDVVLGGCSMGGAIIMAFLRHSPLAAHVRALVLDSPMLDFRATIAHGSKLANTPAVLARPGRWIAGKLFALDWRETNYLRDAATTVSVPVLLFHGEDDHTVPVETSDRFAETLGERVRYLRTPGVGHVRSWNADPAGYEAAVEAFLRAQAGLATPSEVGARVSGPSMSPSPAAAGEGLG